jgi:hypothetical protein
VRQRRQRQRKKAHNALIHLQLPRRGERKEKKKIGVQKQSKTENTTKEEKKGGEARRESGVDSNSRQLNFNFKFNFKTNSNKKEGKLE